MINLDMCYYFSKDEIFSVCMLNNYLIKFFLYFRPCSPMMYGWLIILGNIEYPLCAFFSKRTDVSPTIFYDILYIFTNN